MLHSPHIWMVPAEPVDGSAKLVGVETLFFLRLGDGSAGTMGRLRGADCRFRLASGAGNFSIPRAWSNFQWSRPRAPRNCLTCSAKLVEVESSSFFGSGDGSVGTNGRFRGTDSQLPPWPLARKAILPRVGSSGVDRGFRGASSRLRHASRSQSLVLLQTLGSACKNHSRAPRADCRFRLGTARNFFLCSSYGGGHTHRWLAGKS